MVDQWRHLGAFYQTDTNTLKLGAVSTVSKSESTLKLTPCFHGLGIFAWYARMLMFVRLFFHLFSDQKSHDSIVL